MKSYWKRMGLESNRTDLLIRREVIQIHNRENAMWRVMEVEMGVMPLSAEEQQGLATRSQKSRGRIWPNLRGYGAPRHLDFRFLTSNTMGEHISVVLSASLGVLGYSNYRKQIQPGTSVLLAVVWSWGRVPPGGESPASWHPSFLSRWKLQQQSRGE